MKRNNRFSIAAALLIGALLFGVFSLMISATDELSVSARAAALYEPENGKFIFEKNKNARLPMASTTKIMTALIAIENADLTEKVKIDPRAIGIEGSSLYLENGEELSLEDLVYAVMLRSANDAAAAIAYRISGSIEDFAALMNERARALGLRDTHFTNPHGLDDEDHYTSAGDLAIIAASAVKNETFKKIASTYKKTIENSAGTRRLLVNHNKLLLLYDGAIGMKTGFTKRSGRCLVGAAERDGVTLVSVTINAPDDWNDHKRMLDLGFSLYEARELAAPGEYSYTLPVVGSDTEAIIAKNISRLTKIREKSAPEIQATVKLSRYVAAPIQKGDILGRVIFTENGTEIGWVDIVAAEGAMIKKEKHFFDIFRKKD